MIQSISDRLKIVFIVQTVKYIDPNRDEHKGHRICRCQDISEKAFFFLSL